MLRKLLKFIPGVRRLVTVIGEFRDRLTRNEQAIIRNEQAILQSERNGDPIGTRIRAIEAEVRLTVLQDRLEELSQNFLAFTCSELPQIFDHRLDVVKQLVRSSEEATKHVLSEVPRVIDKRFAALDEKIGAIAQIIRSSQEAIEYKFASWTLTELSQVIDERVDPIAQAVRSTQRAVDLTMLRLRIELELLSKQVFIAPVDEARTMTIENKTSNGINGGVGEVGSASEDFKSNLSIKTEYTNPRVIDLPGIPPFAISVHSGTDLFISKSILQNGVWEPCETNAFIKLLSADTDVIDAGANIGWYTVLASMALKGRGTVHAFEPDRTNFAILVDNVRFNGITNANCLNLALSDHCRGAHLFLDRDNMGDHRLYESGDGRESIFTKTMQIDSYSGLSPTRALIIKLDTQGSEVSILRGMKRLLSSHPAEIVLISEFWPFGLAKSGSCADELIDLAEAAGFFPFLIEPPSLVRTSWDSLRKRVRLDLSPSTMDHRDFIAFRENSQMKALVAAMII